jgi:hypothetical protein
MSQETHREKHDQGLEVHHIIPRRANGSDSPENLLAVCVSCHSTLEHTQADALERVYQVSDEAELRSQVEQLKTRADKLEAERDDLIEELTAFLEDTTTSITIHLVHETRLSTSRLLRVTTDMDEAVEAYRNAEYHATLESANVTVDRDEYDRLRSVID